MKAGLWKYPPALKKQPPNFCLALLLLVLWGVPTPLFSYERIISLKPNITEVVFALGLGSKLVGVTSYCNYPPEAKKLPVVSDYIQPSLEKVILQKPDLILTSAENGSKREIDFLSAKGYKIETTLWNDFEQTQKSIVYLGKLLGRENESNNILRQINADLRQIELRNQNRKGSNKIKVLFVVGMQPLIVAGSNNIFDDAAKLLDLENVAGASSLKYPNYSLEKMLKSDADIVIDFSLGMGSSQKSKEQQLEWWSKYSLLPAVKKNQIYFFPIEDLRSSQNFTKAVLKMQELIVNAK